MIGYSSVSCVFGEGGKIKWYINIVVYGSIIRYDNVIVEVFFDVEVIFYDRVVGSFMDISSFEIKERRLEESFGVLELFVINGDDLIVRKFVWFFKLRRLSGSLEFLFKVEGDVIKFFFNVLNDFLFGRGGEEVIMFYENFDEVVGKVLISKIDMEDSVGKGEIFVDGDSVGDIVIRVKNDIGGLVGSVKRENGLDRDVEGRGIESFEYDLGYFFLVLFGVKGSFSEENGVFFRSDMEFIVEGMVLDFFYVVLVCDDIMFNGVF